MIIDNIKNFPFYYELDNKITTALKYLQNNDLSKFENGRYEILDDEIYVLIQSYKTKPVEEGKWESHKKYMDIQFVIEGQERIGYVNIDALKPITEYDNEKDICFFEGNGDFLTLKAGDFILFAAQDAHMPGIFVENSENVKKAVVKIKV